MLNLIMKFIICWAVVTMSGALLTNVYFASAYHTAMIAATLALAGHLLEWAMLSKKTFWLTLVMDFIFSTAIIYVLSYFFFASVVTFGGAAVIALVLTAIEFFVHVWLLQSGRAHREPRLG